MTTVPHPPLLTAEDLEAGGERYDYCELWDGTLLVRSPSNIRPEVVAARIACRLGVHVDERGLGWVCLSNTGFVLARNPDRVLSPDTAFISKERLPTLPARGFCPMAPDFCVEVCSPSQSWLETVAKAGIWIAHGVRVVWAVDPETETVAVLRAGLAPVEAHPGDLVDAAPALPDFRVAVADILRDLAGGASLMR